MRTCSPSLIVFALLFAVLPLHAQWQRVMPDLSAGLNDIAALDIGRALAVGSDFPDSLGDGQAFITMDGGLSWDSIRFSAPGGMFRTLYQAEWVDAQTLYASSFRPHLFASLDGGATWEERPTPDGDGAAMESMHWWNADSGLVGNLEGRLYRTYNGGNTWELVFNSGFAQPLIDLDCPSYQTCYIRTFGVADLYKSTDGGSSWLPLPGTPSVLLYTGLDALNEDTVVLVTWGTAYRSTDGGASWSTISVPTSVELTDVDFAGPFGVAVGGDATILHSTDYGETWTLVHTDSIAGLHFTAVAVLNDSTAWACSREGAVFRFGGLPTTNHLSESVPLKWHLGPNPARGQLDVQTPVGMAGTLQLINSRGQVVLQQAFASGEHLVLESASTGWHWCRLQLIDGRIAGKPVWLLPALY